MHITDEQTSRQEKEGEGEREAAGQAFSPLHEVVFVTLLCCTQLITQSAFGSVLVPLQLIGLSFDSNSVGQRSWFLAAYSLTVGTFVLVAGQLGDIYGHKKMLVGGWFWFGLWSLIAGLSAYTSSTIFFDVCRALQGIGPAFLLPNGLAILSGAYPPGRRKEMVFAFFAAMAPVGFVVGAVFGSLFAQLVWWPWGFYCTAIVCVMISLLAYVVIPARDAAPEREVKEAFDLVGAVFGVVGLVLVNFAWNQATVVGWTTSYTYATLILGIVSLTIFGFHERKTPNPLLPMDIWNGSAICIIACLGLGWSSFGVWVFYTYQVIEVLRDVTPLAAAAQFVPEMISGIVAAITTGYLLSRVPTTWMMVVASTAFFIGCLLSATAPVRQTYWANIFVSMMVMAWGMDISFPASTLILSNMVPAKRQGIAASLINTVVNYSVSIGLGIAGTVESGVNDHGRDVLKGYRAALWTSVGLSGCGVIVSLGFASWMTWKEAARRKP